MPGTGPRQRDRGAASAPDDTLQVVCFGVAGEDYALDIMRVKEIINPVEITEVPRAPALVQGIIELRGTFMAVIDLRERFGLAPTPLERASKFIVVALDTQRVALIVDRVIEVRRIAASDIRPPPDALAGPRAQLVSGVVKSGDRIVMLVNLDGVLSPAERDELREVESEM